MATDLLPCFQIGGTKAWTKAWTLFIGITQSIQKQMRLFFWCRTSLKMDTNHYYPLQHGQEPLIRDVRPWWLPFGQVSSSGYIRKDCQPQWLPLLIIGNHPSASLTRYIIHQETGLCPDSCRSDCSCFEDEPAIQSCHSQLSSSLINIFFYGSPNKHDKPVWNGI